MSGDSSSENVCIVCQQWHEHLQPCRLPADRSVFLLCPAHYGRVSAAVALSVPYVHPRYTPGLDVYVSPSIVELHGACPLAGCVVRTCEGRYFPLQDAFERRSHETYVPVWYEGGVWCIEEEYIAAVG
jgi:hypothetical protein